MKIKCPLCREQYDEDADLMWHLRNSHDLFQWSGGLHCPCGYSAGDATTSGSEDFAKMVQHFIDMGVTEHIKDVAVLMALQKGCS